MKKIACKNAFYIKLGRTGVWEDSSIKNNIMRIGWVSQSVHDINNGNWEKIKKELEGEINSKGVATRDYRALRMICESTPEDIWITFNSNYLWWCRVAEEKIFEDDISKYRKVDKWKRENINGEHLIINNISGRISKLQGFRGTVCKVKEVDELVRLINSEDSPEYLAIKKSKSILCHNVEKALKLLHWKDFETIVDLVFRGAGWRRVSILGETMKFSDIELEDPINNDFYQVQVKSSSTYKEFEDYKIKFDRDKYRKLFFVVHSPDEKLANIKNMSDDGVHLVLPGKLSEMVVDSGLTNWLMRKIK